MWPWWINYPFWLDADCSCLPLHEYMISVHVCPSVCMCSYLQHVKVCYSLSLVQFSCSVMYDSLQPMYYNTPPRPSPTPRACSNSYPSGHWRHPTISSSVLSFSSCLQSFPAPGSFPMSRLLSLELTKNVNLMILLSNFVSYHCNDCENYWPSFLYSKLILNFWLFSPLLPLSGKLLL